jgi:hypothetical protein
MVAQSLSLGQWLLLGKTCLVACEAPVGHDMPPQAAITNPLHVNLLAMRLRIVSLRFSAVRCFQRPWFR